MVHSCDFKEFFKKKGVAKIKGLTFNSDDPYHEYDIDKLKLILTESQFKMAAFIIASSSASLNLSEFAPKVLEQTRLLPASK